MELPGSHDRSGEISKLESKVVLAMSRLQKGRYPMRQGKHGGIASKQVANYLANHYCYLDGDIESQVMTSLLSCVKNGTVCALNNGKFRLVNPNSRNMATNCMSRTRHGPECTCLNLIDSIRNSSHKTCCSYGVKIKVKFAKNSSRRRGRPRKSETRKSSKRSKSRARREETRKPRKTSTKCIQKEVKVLKEVPPPVKDPKSNKKENKCKYCFEKHSPPDPFGKKLCRKCHPPGTRYGVPYDKFSPREDTTTN